MFGGYVVFVCYGFGGGRMFEKCWVASFLDIFCVISYVICMKNPQYRWFQFGYLDPQFGSHYVFFGQDVPSAESRWDVEVKED